MSYCNKKTSFDVSIDYQLYQSGKGKYFIGQTPVLTGENEHAIAMLYNPSNSNRNIYVNAITITNISDNNLSAEFYLRSLSNKGKISNLVSCANTSIYLEPNPKGQIKYLNPASKPPCDGVSIFSRIVSPNSTLVVDGGQIILGQDQSLSVYIGGFLPIIIDNIRFAFGWWEERVSNNNDC